MPAHFTANSNLPLIALVFGGFVMGLSPVLVRLADVGFMASGFFRLALAFPIVAVMAWFAGRSEPAASGPWRLRDWLFLALTGIAFGIDIVFWHLALKYTTVADATLLGNLAPILVAGGAWMLFSERFGWVFSVGLAVALAGAASLVLQKGPGAPPLDRLLGDLYAVGAATAYAAYLLIIRSMRGRVSTRAIIVASTGGSALVLLPFALVSPEPFWPQSMAGWGVLAALAMVCHAGGQGALTYALAHLPASFTSMSQLLQTAIAALAAWVVLSEPLTWGKGVSAVAILTGLWICRAGSELPRRPLMPAAGPVELPARPGPV